MNICGSDDGSGEMGEGQTEVVVEVTGGESSVGGEEVGSESD